MKSARSWSAGFAIASSLVLLLAVTGSNANAQDDAYRPPSDSSAQDGSYSDGANSYGGPRRSQGDASSGYPAPQTYDQAGGGNAYPQGDRGQTNNGYQPYGSAPAPRNDTSGYGEPYTDPPQNSASRDRGYDDGPPPYEERGPRRSSYSEDEIIRAGGNFFGKVSSGLASAIEWAFQKGGRPNGYILGQNAGGAFVAGLAYGEGQLYTKDAGTYKVYWQGPSIGYDFGADGSKVMTLVYNLHDPEEIYDRFGGVEGAAYLVGGVSVQWQKAGHVTLAPIRAGVGLRLGANVGYLKYTRNPTWNPF